MRTALALLPVIVLGVSATVVRAAEEKKDDPGAALQKLVGAGVEAGGLKRVPDPNNANATLLELGDIDKLKAFAKKRGDLWSAGLRDLLVAAWFQVDAAQKAVVSEVLYQFGKAQNDRLATARGAYYRGLAAHLADKPREAIPHFKEALDEFTEAKDRKGQADALGFMADDYRALREFKNAMSSYERTLEIQKLLAPGPDPAVALTYAGIAMTYDDMGKLDEALSYHKQSLDMLLKVQPPVPRMVVGAWKSVARAHTSRNDHEKARECLEEALKLQRELAKGPSLAVAAVLRRIGLCEMKLGNYAKAIESCRKALDMIRELTDAEPGEEAECLECIGDAQVQLGRQREAKQQYLAALELARRDKDPYFLKSQALLLEKLCTTALALGDYGSAREYVESAFELWRRIHPKPHFDHVNNLLNQRLVYLSSGDPKQAANVLDRAEKMLRDAFQSPTPEMAPLLISIARGIGDRGDQERAQRLLKEALRLLEDASPNLQFHAVMAHIDLAEIAFENGATASWKEYMQHALELARSLPGSVTYLETVVIGEFAFKLAALGERGRAVELYEEALALAIKRHGAEHAETAAVLRKFASTLSLPEVDDLERAEIVATRALALTRKTRTPSHVETLNAAGTLSSILTRRGDFARSLKVSEAALSESGLDLNSDNVHLARLLDQIADANSGLGDYRKAAEAKEKSIGILERAYGPTHQQLAIGLIGAASLAMRHGDYSKTVSYCERALKALSDSYAENYFMVFNAHMNLGTAYGQLGDQRRSLAAYDKALRGVTVPPEKGALAEPLTANVLQPSARALDIVLMRAVEKEKSAKSIDELRSCANDYLVGLALLERVRKESVESAESRIAIGERPAASGFSARYLGICHKLAALEDVDATRSAFEALERSRAAVFVQSLRESRAGMFASLPNDVRQRGEELERRLRGIDYQIGRYRNKLGAAEAANLTRLWRERETVETELRKHLEDAAKAHPRFAALTRAKSCSLDEARSALRDNEVALLFALAGDVSYVLLLEKKPNAKDGGLTIFPISKRRPIADKVAALLDPGTLRSTAETKELGAELYQLLLAPLAERIRGKDLLIVPDGPLGYLPFELLAEKPDGKFLIEECGIRYAPSLTALHLIGQWDAQRPRPDAMLWAMGDPIYDPKDARSPKGAAISPVGEEQVRELRQLTGSGGTFRRLTHSKTEVEQIAQLLKVADSTVHVAEGASEASVKAASSSGALAKARYVHFATHGILGQSRGQQPALVLSLIGASGQTDAHGTDDGFLRLDEVAALKLNADLVVLSACDTGRGRLHDGEGVVGLARAFLAAGSRAVTPSLWQVDDERTARFMIATYGKLASKVHPDVALREAKRDFIRAGHSPYFWGGFIFVGR